MPKRKKHKAVPPSSETSACPEHGRRVPSAWPEPAERVAEADNGLEKQGAPAVPPKPRWPGCCPDCGSPLEFYSKHTDFQQMKRTRYFRCSNFGRCSFRSKITEAITARKPVTAPSEAEGRWANSRKLRVLRDVGERADIGGDARSSRYCLFRASLGHVPGWTRDTRQITQTFRLA